MEGTRKECRLFVGLNLKVDPITHCKAPATPVQIILLFDPELSPEEVMLE